MERVDDAKLVGSNAQQRRTQVPTGGALDVAGTAKLNQHFDCKLVTTTRMTLPAQYIVLEETASQKKLGAHGVTTMRVGIGAVGDMLSVAYAKLGTPSAGELVQISVKYQVDAAAWNKLRRAIPKDILSQLSTDWHATLLRKAPGVKCESHRDQGGVLGIHLSGRSLMAVAFEGMCIKVDTGVKVNTAWWNQLVENREDICSREEINGDWPNDGALVVRRRLVAGAMICYYIRALNPGDVYLLPASSTGYTARHQFVSSPQTYTLSVLLGWNCPKFTTTVSNTSIVESIPLHTS